MRPQGCVHRIQKNQISKIKIVEEEFLKLKISLILHFEFYILNLLQRYPPSDILSSSS